MKNSFLNIHEVFLILTALESLFLVLLFKVLPSKQQQSRNMLASFFVLIAGTLLSTLIIWNSFLWTQPIAHSRVVPIILSCCSLLQGPMLYFYLRSLSEQVYLWRWINLLHLLPSVVVVAVIIVIDIDIIDWLPWIKLSPRDHAAVKFVWAILKCLPLAYVLACFYVEYRLRQQLRDNCSHISSKELLWADIVLAGFFISWLWSFVAYFLGAYLSDYMNDLLGVLSNYFTVLLVNTLFAFGALNTRQLLHVATIDTLDTTKPVELLNIDEKIATIERGLHQQKLYLDSQVNLDRFSEQIGLKSRDVSIIINSHYNSNFFEFINGYRVEEAKRLLVAPENKSDTILDIIYKSGFNSQSAFHRFFKRITGVTPSEYRKLILQAGDKINE